MIPEAEHEKENLEALWKLIIRCDEDSNQKNILPTLLDYSFAIVFKGI